MNVIVLNQNDIVGTTNSVFKYKFRNSVNLSNKEIALASLSMYYSWFNITPELGNTKFFITWEGGVPATYTITIPQGIWSIKAINAYLQQFCINNGFYLIDGAGDFVYFAEIIINQEEYGINLITYPVPIVLPVGYTEPANWAGYAADFFNPVLTIPSAFNQIIGYTAGFATDVNTGNNTILTYLSSTSPDIQPIETLLITIDNVSNDYTINYGTIYSLTPQVQGGQLIVEKPPSLIFAPFINGYYSEIVVRFLKTDYTPVTIYDPNITITLSIKDKRTLL